MKWNDRTNGYLNAITAIFWSLAALINFAKGDSFLLKLNLICCSMHMILSFLAFYTHKTKSITQKKRSLSLFPSLSKPKEKVFDFYK